MRNTERLNGIKARLVARLGKIPYYTRALSDDERRDYNRILARVARINEAIDAERGVRWNGYEMEVTRA